MSIYDQFRKKIANTKRYMKTVDENGITRKGYEDYLEDVKCGIQNVMQTKEATNYGYSDKVEKAFYFDADVDVIESDLIVYKEIEYKIDKLRISDNCLLDDHIIAYVYRNVGTK